MEHIDSWPILLLGLTAEQVKKQFSGNASKDFSIPGEINMEVVLRHIIVTHSG